MAEIYILDWQDTKYGQQPKPAEVDAWLKHQGFATVGLTKVYANGQVKVATEGDPSACWPEFEPEPLTVGDELSALIKELIDARADVLAIPQHRRNATERLLLADTALLLYGYGVGLDG